ncbi:hypothetical protein UNSWDHB_2573 [Dehalobacter sp. UNSWDHB]|nr:hypothetical protein DHBDCA_p2390 [Dehalobacter sp. DCA]AFV06404.1 hypothetical protein DCF50_p2401 [Dehalobacter sp. CF]EQB20104.1 hypothetical protein UNSWDHB_2573 [Dehalobacter sp. UNSWDHB]
MSFTLRKFNLKHDTFLPFKYFCSIKFSLSLSFHYLYLTGMY